MNIEDLRDILNELIESGYCGDVKLLEQPAYPFIYDIKGVGVKDGVVYLLEGEQLDYGFKFDELDEEY